MVQISEHGFPNLQAFSRLQVGVCPVHDPKKVACDQVVRPWVAICPLTAESLWLTEGHGWPDVQGHLLGVGQAALGTGPQLCSRILCQILLQKDKRPDEYKLWLHNFPAEI